MTVAIERDASPAAAGTTLGPAPGLRWMYALIIVALAGLGAGASQITFFVHDLGHMTSVQSCLLDHGIRLSDPGLQDITGSSARLPDFASCADPYNRGQGAVMLIGIVATLVLAWLLMLGSGIAMRRRLRRRASARSGPLVEAATDRFGHWCDRAGLTGRHRPFLLLARPGRLTDQAFTTALPFSRPTVVIPIGYVHLDRDQLDVVLLHELAHVRSRDLTWASATWWAGWLNLPLLLAAILPLLAKPATLNTDFRSTLLLAVILSLAALTLRSAVLRRREQAADAYAVRVAGAPDGFRAVAAASIRPESDAPPLRVLLWRVRGWVSTHPAPEIRAETAGSASDGWEGGFAVAAATGVLAIFLFKSLDTILIDVSGFAWPWSDLPGDLSLAVAGLVWAVTLVPAWMRRSRTGGARWWAALAGSATGLVAGYLVPAPGAIVPQGLIDLIGFRIGPLLWLTGIALAVSVFGVGLAITAAAAVRRHRAVVIAAVAAATVTLCAAFSTVTTLVVTHIRTPASGFDRVLLAAQADTEWFAWTPVFLLICAAVLAASAPRTTLPTATLVTVAFTGALIATVATQIRVHTAIGPDSIYLLLTQRDWICAVTGWVCALVVLRTAGPRPAFAAAVLTGAAASALVGVVQYLRDLGTGRSGHSLHNLFEFLRIPIWLMFVLIVITFAAAGDLVRWCAASPAGVRIRATAAVAVLALAVATGVTAPLTVARGDWNRFTAAVAADRIRNTPAGPATLPPDPLVSYPPGTADPGRILTPAAITAALASVRHVLSPQWKPGQNSPDTSQKDVEPASCADKLDRDTAVENAQVRVAQKKTTLELPDDAMPPLGTTLVMYVQSFASPADATSYVTDARGEATACAQWTAPASGSDNGRARFTMHADGGTGSSYPGFRILLTESWRVNGTPGIVIGSLSWVIIGHNVISVDAVYAYLGKTAVPATRVRTVRGFTDTAVASIIASLQRD